MDRANVLTLIHVEPIKDAMGQIKQIETLRVIPCTVRSVSASEFFSGGQTGYNPEWQVTVFCGDYLNEKEADLDGVRYSIYRKYQGRNDNLELYLQKKVGDSLAT